MLTVNSQYTTTCYFCSLKIEDSSESLVVLNKYGINTEMVICSCCFSFCPKLKTITDQKKECLHQAMFHEAFWSQDNEYEYCHALDIARIIDDYGEFFNPYKKKLICDIGSGRGNLLKALLDKGFNAIGCEPAELLFQKAIQLYELTNSQLFNCDASSFAMMLKNQNLKPSIFLFWHVIEHIPHSFELIKSFVDQNSNSQDVLLVFQTPLLIAEHIFDEHLFFPTHKTYYWLAQKLGFEILCLKQELTYGFLTCIMNKAANTAADETKTQGNIMESNLRILGLTEEITELLLSEINTGEVVLVIPTNYTQDFDFTKLNLSPNARIIDLRDKSGIKGLSLIRGKHPRLGQLWTQYSHCNTGLSRNIVISDVLQPDCKVETWESAIHTVQPAPYGQPLASEEYKHLHNHYQNLLVETFNFSPDVNSISVWGDSAALVPNAKSWGGFFSARSWPLQWEGVTPSTVPSYDEEDFDAALVGIEIDVLNKGKPWKSDGKTLAKIGLQLVGFQNENTAAIEIRSEDSDDPEKNSSTRNGCWHWGIIMRNSLSATSTVLYSENQTIYRGIDFSETSFTDGAVVIKGGSEKSGIFFTNGAEIFSSDDGYLTLKAGVKGVRILSDDGQRVLLNIPNQSSSLPNSNDIKSFAPTVQRLYNKKHDYQQTISVCHIPKCMGSWLRKELLFSLGSERTFKPVATFVGNPVDYDILNQIKSVGVSNYSMLEGHFVMNSEFTDTIATCYCITSIRNPIDLLRSHLNYINDQIKRHKILEYNSLEQFLDKNTYSFDNLMTRYLAGIDSVELFDEITGQSAVSVACHNIETKFDFIFIDKYLDACCDFFYKLTNMSITPQEIVNKTDISNWLFNKKVFNDTIQDSKFYAFVKYDIIVYEFAINKFKNQVSLCLNQL